DASASGAQDSPTVGRGEDGRGDLAKGARGGGPGGRLLLLLTGDGQPADAHARRGHVREWRQGGWAWSRWGLAAEGGDHAPGGLPPGWPLDAPGSRPHGTARPLGLAGLAR